MSNSADEILVDKPSVEQQVIIDKKFEDSDPIKKELIETPRGFYNILHQMANTKIVAKDGQRWGFVAMTKENVKTMQKAYKDLDISNSLIEDMLENWSKQEFYNAVEEHNLVWNLLEGNVGMAQRLR